MIQYATEKNLLSIAECHIKAFPKSVTSLLGKKVVSSMLQWYLSADNKFLFFIEEDKKVIGYCGGYINSGTEQYGSSSGMTQFGMQSALFAFILKPWLLFHPEIRKKYRFIFVNIKRKLGLLPTSVITPVSTTNTPLAKEPVAGLVVIGVLPSYQKKGIGSQLQKEFESIARRKGAVKLSLSVRMENTQAQKSYERNGYKILNNDGISYIMTKNL